MESIIVYPKNEQQTSLLKSLLKEMKVRFEIGNDDPTTALSESEFIAKIDKSIQQAEAGKTKHISKDEQKKFLGL
ncbi:MULTISPECIES: DUF2683 family protein [Runella]|uniref:Uncharacterized protein n=1 Tax=Runella defluvii TaxID=370973 RepID=A0A7W5ZH76_9BACT|nr:MULTISPECIES: DUF2683 family protein [Runella]AYQ34021.1 hypothetical protein DTQ70_18490 [Runella sp. SP2]MBB3837243.1 hypothetical protein [Runella defluvii]